MKTYTVAVLGATGAVGREMISILEERNFPVGKLVPLASARSAGKTLKFKGEETTAEIGDNTTIRECVTINRGTASRGKTVIGNNCLIMAYCHVAHDSELGNNVIMSNAVQVAGEVTIDDYSVIGGGALIHQFTHIGQHVMVQGGSLVNKDIPPFVMAGRLPVSYAGINTVGLRRRGFTNEQIGEIQEIYR